MKNWLWILAGAGVLWLVSKNAAAAPKLPSTSVGQAAAAALQDLQKATGNDYKSLSDYVSGIPDFLQPWSF